MYVLAYTFLCGILETEHKLTVVSRHWLSRIAPQYPRKLRKNMTAPIAIRQYASCSITCGCVKCCEINIKCRTRSVQLDELQLIKCGA